MVEPVDLEDVVDFLAGLLASLPQDRAGLSIRIESPDMTAEERQLLDETWARIQAGEFWDRDPSRE